MPTVNVPAPVRFGLYLFSAIGTVAIGYLVAKNYIGDAETAAWGGLVAIINVLAASNVNLSGNVPVLIDNAAGEVADEDAAAELEGGATDALTILVVVALVLLCLVLLGVIR